jgi:hypothetical protein
MNKKLKIKKNCLVCSKIFETSNTQIKKGYGKYCSNKCYAISMKGKKQSPERAKKSRESLQKLIKKKRDYKWRINISKSKKGSKSHFWKGGVTSNMKEYSRTKWKSKRENQAGSERPKNCQICGSNNRICYDHDHHTERFRGWICWRCNATLGMVKDSIKTLKLLIKYLENED